MVHRMRVPRLRRSDEFVATCTQGFRPGLGVCRAYGAGCLAVLLAIFGELVVEEIRQVVVIGEDVGFWGVVDCALAHCIWLRGVAREWRGGCVRVSVCD